MQDIKDVQRRANAYWFIDGLPEIVGGAAAAICGGLLYAAVASGVEWLGTAALGFLIVAFPVSAWLVKSLKEHITYPRTGYIEYAPPSRSRRLVAVAVGFVAAGLMVPAAAIANGDAVSSAVLGAGGAMAAIVALRAWRTAAPRFYIAAAALVVASGVLSTSGAGVVGSIGLLLGLYGLAAIVMGAWTLVRYLRANGELPGGAA